jgi:RNA-directed DNA polymerase
MAVPLRALALPGLLGLKCYVNAHSHFQSLSIKMDINLAASPQELQRKFYSLQTPRDCADLLEIDYSNLVYHLYKVPADERYTTFPLTKRNGGTRTISAPATALKIIQRKLAYVLRCVYEPKAPAHAYLKDKSIVTNAEMHRRRRFVLNVDLENFFPSITFKRVRGLFMAVPYNRNKSVATVLAQICCHENVLPQGAPTSPIISNMICAKMDSQLRRLAVKHRCVYTRYADDLTFSTSLRNFPENLAKVSPTDSLPGVVVGPELKHVIETNGFRVNGKKVRLQTANRRQVVTGLVVNRFPSVGGRFVSKTRAMLHAWEKFGLENAESHFRDQYDKKNRSPHQPEVSFAQVVRGKIEFIGMVQGKNSPIYRTFLEKLASLDPKLVKKSITELKAESQVNEQRRLVLKRVLKMHFNKREIEELCFSLSVYHEDLRTNTISEFIEDLILYMERRNRIQELVERIAEERSTVINENDLELLRGVT